MINMRKILSLLFAVVFLILQTGCIYAFYGRTEISRIEFIRAVGVDKCPGEKNTVRLTIATERVQADSGGGGERKKSEILTSDGSTVFEAVRNFWNYMEKRPFWGHLEYVLIGEEAAKEGLTKYIDFFSRDPEVRLNLKVYIAKGLAAEEVVNRSSGEDKFVFDRLQGVTENQWGQSIFNVVNLFEVMYILDNKSLSLYLPSFELSQFTTDTNEQVDIVMKGFAIFKGDKLMGYLDEKMGRGLNWLRNKVNSGIIVVKSPKTNNVSLEIIESRSKFVPEIINGQLSVTIKVIMSSNIAEIQSTEDLFTEEAMRFLETKQEQKIKEEIESVIRYAQERKLEFFGTAYAVEHKYPIEWEDNYEKNWGEVASHINFNVIVESKINRTYDIKQPNRGKDGVQI